MPLLHRLAKTSPPLHNLLTTQYRMPPKLAEIVSSQFYNNALTTAPCTAATRLRGHPVVFVHVDGKEERRGTSFANRAEVARVVELVTRERQAHPHQTVTVVCFHKPQYHAVRHELTRCGLMDATDAMVAVRTVDSMQGREADVVILSCVRTGDSLGFLKDRNRLNVALSRPKQVLYIVGHKSTLVTHSKWGNVINHDHTFSEL